MQKIKYIDNNPQKGIKIDWNMIFKEYKKLGCPENVYDPTTFPVNVVNWGVLLSARYRGKTTNWILIGLLLFKHYGIQTGYIRQTDRMTTSTKTKDLMNVVLQFDYIPKIFGDKWNGVYLWQKHYYLCKRDAEGKIEEKCQEDFLMLLSIDKNIEYKSTLTKPKMDLLLFDEFISDKYAPNEFIDLCQLIATVKRKRTSVKVICLSNMVTPYSQYLEEMGLRDTAIKYNQWKEEVKNEEEGYGRIVETILGLKIYFEVVGGKKYKRDAAEVHANMAYFGFANKQLSAITGEDWEVRNYPHLPRPEEEEERELITREVYIYAFGTYLCMEFYTSNIMGAYVLIRPYPLRVPDDGIIFTDQIPTKQNEIYGTGTGTNFHKLWNLVGAHRDFYSSNEVGHMVESFLSTVE